MVEVSVVVFADASGTLLPLISSLDLQTLTTDRFELVIVDRGLDEARAAALHRVVGRRPNLRVVSPAEEWLPTLTGDYVLAARGDQKLFPEALERLAAYAREHGLDVVAGRPVQPRQPLLSVFAADSAELSPDDVETALGSSVLLTTTSRFRTESGGWRVDGAGARVGVLASYPAADEPALPASATETVAASCDAASLAWDGSELALTASGPVRSGRSVQLTPVVLARQIGSHLTFLLPTQGQVSAEPGSYAVRWQAEARLAPLTAAAGAALPPGLWELDVVLSGSAGASAPTTVRTAAPGPALLPGMVVSTGASASGNVQVDVGATRHPVIGTADAALARVTESARGSVLELPLPGVHVQTDEALPGLISVGRIKVPARIETAGGSAVFTAFVSGLVGTAPISVQFGRCGVKPIGVSLQIFGTGAMAVVPTPAEAAAPAKAAAAKAPAAKPPAAKKPRKKGARKPSKPASGPVATLRRAVPAPLEPLARRLSRTPAAQKAYRRLTGLAK